MDNEWVYILDCQSPTHSFISSASSDEDTTSVADAIIENTHIEESIDSWLRRPETKELITEYIKDKEVTSIKDAIRMFLTSLLKPEAIIKKDQDEILTYMKKHKWYVSEEEVYVKDLTIAIIENVIKRNEEEVYVKDLTIAIIENVIKMNEEEVYVKDLTIAIIENVIKTSSVTNNYNTYYLPVIGGVILVVVAIYIYKSLN